MITLINILKELELLEGRSLSAEELAQKLDTSISNIESFLLFPPGKWFVKRAHAIGQVNGFSLNPKGQQLLDKEKQPLEEIDTDYNFPTL